MRRNPSSKLLAGVFVLVMALSAMTGLAGEASAQTSWTVNIYVPVVSSGSPVLGATVTLTDVHTGEVVVATYDETKSSYKASDAPSGYYRLDVTHIDYWDALDVDTFPYDGMSNKTMTPVVLDEFPYKEYEWSLTIRDLNTNRLLTGATVGFYDHGDTGKYDGEYVSLTTSNSLGVANLSMFESNMPGDFDLVVIKSGYDTMVIRTAITSDNTSTVLMTPSKRVTGFVTDANGPATNVVSYLICKDSNEPWVRRVMKSTGSILAFDAYDGDFVLVVDAEGAAAYVTEITVSSSTQLAIPTLSSQSRMNESVNITFGADFNSFDLSVNAMWSYDKAYPGLRYSDIGSLRAQVDLLLGDGNGQVETGEVFAFYGMVQGFGSQYVTSQRLMVVNDTVYDSDPITDFALSLAEGSVDDETAVAYSYACHYTAHEEIDLNATEYTAVGYARYDSESVNYVYTVHLVSEYELVSNSTGSLQSHVNIYGYTPIFVMDPEEYSGGPEPVELIFEKLIAPEARALVTESATAYAVKDDENNVTHYIVKVNENITFNASASNDPNGNPLIFTWDFNDSSESVETRNMSVVHVFNVSSAAREVNLTVTDMSGLTNYTTVTVICDGTLPTPVISVLKRTINVTDNSISLNQSEAATFNGTASVDGAVFATDGLGVIDHYEFEWGDGNFSGDIQWTSINKNATHSYERAGTYTLILNVTDVVGNWKNTSLTVKVNDTTKPTVSYLVKNETWGTSLIENKTLTFDANATVDNFDEIDNLTFSWYFGDDSWYNATGAEGGANVTHNYTSVGSFTTSVNVTDTSGNWQKVPKVIQVQAKPRPNMIVDVIYFDPDEGWVEGEGIWLIVNMTNSGSAPATNVTVRFMLMDGSNFVEMLGTTTAIYDENGTLAIDSVPVEGKAVAKLLWTPDAKGSYKIRANVTATDQLEEKGKTSNTLIEVDEAPWKQWLLWGGVLAVLILVPVLLYFRGRLAKREKKGPRRERKEKEREREKEKDRGGEDEDEL